MTDLDYFTGNTPDMKFREEQIEKLEATRRLIKRVGREFRDLSEDLGNLHHYSMHFPQTRQRMVNRQKFLIDAEPRLKSYFNFLLKSLSYE